MAGTVILIALDGPRNGQRLVLRQGRHRVGRLPDCELSIDDPEVSREHCLIDVESDTAWISDSGSQLGTIVNGQITTDRTPLLNGDLLVIGSSLFTVESESPRPRPPSAARTAPSPVSAEPVGGRLTSEISDAAQHTQRLVARLVRVIDLLEQSDRVSTGAGAAQPARAERVRQAREAVARFQKSASNADPRERAARASELLPLLDLPLRDAVARLQSTLKGL